MPLNCQTEKTQETTKKFNALAHILPKIGRVTCLTLKNVRDLDVEGHASIVQGFWQCHWIARPKKPEKHEKLQCSSTYTSRDRKGHMSDLEKSPWPWSRRSRINCTMSMWVSLNFQTQKNEKQKKLQCSSTYTSGDRKGDVTDLEKCPWPWGRRSPYGQKKSMIVPLSCQTQKT